MNADSVRPAGLNQSQLKGIPVGESADSTIAMTAKMSRHHHLESHQDELDLLGGGDPAVGDVCGDGEEGQAGRHVDDLVLPQLGDPVAADEVAHELVGELDGHACQVGQDDDGGEDRGPATDPPHVGTERLGRPGEGGAAVGGDLVQLPVGVRREEHRQEPAQEDHGDLRAGLADEQADGRREGVGRSHAGDRQDRAAHESRPSCCDRPLSWRSCSASWWESCAWISMPPSVRCWYWAIARLWYWVHTRAVEAPDGCATEQFSPRIRPGSVARAPCAAAFDRWSVRSSWRVGPRPSRGSEAWTTPQRAHAHP